MFYRALLAMLATLLLSTTVFAALDSANTESMSSQQSAQQGTDNKVNLNTATTKELLKVKGINATKAKAIIVYRKKHGEFKSTEDLANVKGFKNIKQAKLKQIEAHFTVD